MGLRLAIDVGNTKTKFAIFDGKKLVHNGQMIKFTLDDLLALGKEHGVSYVIISSVKHLNKDIKQLIASDTSYFLLSHTMNLPFKIEYKTPETLGLDRLAGVAGAWSRFPGQNSLVIDTGTCIKYDLITREGKYKGGNISPGLHMRFLAMHKFTNKLPQVEPYKRYQTIGRDTESALQVGAGTGAIHEIEGFIKDYKKSFGKLNILLTGGDALFFVNRLKTKIFAAPHLVLQGLNEILDYHVQ